MPDNTTRAAVSDTSADTPTDDTDADDPRPRLRGRFRWLLAVTCAFTAAAAAWIGPHGSGRVAMTPGPTRDAIAATRGAITDAGFGHHGKFLVTTVSISELSWARYLWDNVGPGDQTETYPIGETSASAHLAAIRQMTAGNRTALQVAATFTAVPAGPAPSGVEIVDPQPGGPADHAGLSAGDVIVAAGPAATPNAKALIAYLADHAGRNVTVTVERAGATRHADLHVDTAGRLEATVVDHYTGTTALTADFGEISGGSGGLMTTLAFIDATSPGDLTGGLIIAGTGTIEPDGTVGPILGAEHKVVGAARDGATVFFAPAGNIRAARAGAPTGIDVVQIDTVTDAVEWLCAHGASDQVCPT